MTFVDHLFLLTLVVAQPVHGTIAWRGYLARVRAGENLTRARLYRDVHLLEWPAFGILIGTWLVLGRPLSDLGMTATAGRGLVASIVLLVAVFGVLVYFGRSLRDASAEVRKKEIDSLGELRHFVPQSTDDYRRFIGVSITAGIVEELVYRGFLFWYLAHWLPAWAAVVVSALIFGLGHSYQGVNGMLRVVLVGLALGGLYLLSGSIWLPIVAHAVLDILQGAMTMELMRKRTADSPPTVVTN